MTLFKCLACGGTYFDESRDRVGFQHVCGPLPATDDLPERERPNKRDENMRFDREGNFLGLVSEGDGVKWLSGKKLDEPGWLAEHRKRAAAREEKDNA